MKNLIQIFGILSFTVLSVFWSCTSPKADNFFNNVVAIRDTIRGDDIIVADIHAFKDTVDLPLSIIAGEVEIIALDNEKKALFSSGNIYLSDNYIGVCSVKPVSFKLFERSSGKYLCDIGTCGNGPGEYQNIYSAQIDEKNGRIYILPMQSRGLLVFGLDGKPYRTIPFPIGEYDVQYDAPKGRFHVNEDGTITVAILPINSNQYVWTQDMDGHLIQKIDKFASVGVLRKLDYSSEILVGKNVGYFDPFLSISFNRLNYTLRRYNVSENRLELAFMVSNIHEVGTVIYYYSEIPGYFTGNFVPDVNQLSESNFTSAEPKHFIVDKHTLRGAYYRLKIDELGGIGVEPYFSEGYFIMNSSAIGLKNKLQDLLNGRETKDPAMRKRIEELNNSINEEDNNIIMLAKLE